MVKSLPFFLKGRYLIFLRDFDGNITDKIYIQRIMIGMIFGNLELLAQHVNDLLFADDPQTREKLPQF